MQRLLNSAKFWTAIIDLVVSLILYFVGKYAAAGAFEDVKFVIAALQPVFLMLIGSIAYEDARIKPWANVKQPEPAEPPQ